jgi:hypothetical protein
MGRGVGRLIQGQPEFVGRASVGQLLPVYDPVNEVGRAAVARERQANAAADDRHSARIDELGIEPDRRLPREGLPAALRDLREQRAARHLVRAARRTLCAGLEAELGAEMVNLRVPGSGSVIKQDRIRREVRQRERVEIVDRGKRVFAEQPGPVIVRAHLHSPFVRAGRPGGRERLPVRASEWRLLPFVRSRTTALLAIAVHAPSPLPPFHTRLVW